MKQEMIVLVGYPGSGKTTLAQNIYPEYERISGDVLGNQNKCIDACHKALSEGKSVVIDRTNINKSQRAHWINLATYYGVKAKAIYLEVDVDECIARIHLRKNHETIKEDLSLDDKRCIVSMFHKNFEMPSLSEGFEEIIIKKG
jgi:predicted kinase